MSHSGKIWSIILAAGESRRMGSPKMLLEFNGRTMLETVIEHVAGSATDGILVVLGAYRDLLTDLVKKAKVSYCINEDYRHGMLSSVQCGIRNLPEDFGAVLVFQGDQPFIFPDQVNMLIRAYREDGKGILIPTSRGKRGHPVLIDCKYAGEIFRLDPEKGLRELTMMYSDDILEIETGAEGILRDFDTPDDYANILNQTK
jgi:molybdenum cofactor cytidylyltransferase